MKSLMALILSAVLIVSISGCGKKPKVESPTQPTSTDKVKPVETEPGTGTTPGGSVTPEQLAKFKTVYFDFDKYNVRDDQKDALRANAQILKDEADIKITIAGHCDERGTVEYNLALGERRAKAVRDYLVSLGIKSNRLSTISYGKEKPVAFGQDEESWQKNRRAEFVE